MVKIIENNDIYILTSDKIEYKYRIIYKNIYFYQKLKNDVL